MQLISKYGFGCKIGEKRVPIEHFLWEIPNPAHPSSVRYFGTLGASTPIHTPYIHCTSHSHIWIPVACKLELRHISSTCCREVSPCHRGTVGLFAILRVKNTFFESVSDTRACAECFFRLTKIPRTAYDLPSIPRISIVQRPCSASA